MKRLLALTAWLLLALALRAEPLAVSLVPPDRPLPAGGAATVELVLFNRGATDAPLAAPTAFVAELAAGGRTWRVELRAVDAATDSSNALAPGRFTTRTYRLTLPAELRGPAMLQARLDGFTPLRGVIDVGASGTVPADRIAAQPAAAATSTDTAAADRVEKPTTNLARAEPAASIIQRTFANRLAPHEPIYFIYGPDAPAAKFQFSFKYKLLDITDLGRNTMARTLQFAFTQRSLWDIEGESSPFYDTSYMPELIFESLAPKPEERDTWFTWLGYQAAFKHESNGRDGPGSRSLNLVYVRPVFAFGQLDGWHLLVIPELFAYIDNLSDNPELKDYRGYGQLRLVFGRNDGPSLMLSTWAGRKFNHPTVQLDLTLPVRTRLLNFETYFLIQYFNGYGESLRAYRDQTETLRAGFSLVR